MRTRNNYNQLTRIQFEALAEVLRAGGVVPASEWVTGAGNYITRRAMPQYCNELEVFGESTIVRVMRGEVGRNARRLYRKRPTIRKLIYIEDLWGARNAAKSFLRAQLARWRRCLSSPTYDLCSAKRAAELVISNIDAVGCAVSISSVEELSDFFRWSVTHAIYGAESARDNAAMMEVR